MDAPAFALTETHREFRDTLRKFAEDRVAPNAAAADRDAVFPRKSFDACVELELPSLGIPVEYGGAGADMVTQAIMAEELARVCASTSVTLLISKLGMLPVMNWGSEERKRNDVRRHLELDKVPHGRADDIVVVFKVVPLLGDFAQGARKIRRDGRLLRDDERSEERRVGK